MQQEYKKGKVMSEMIFCKLKELLSANNARFRVVEHEAAGTSELVATARGTQLGQGAKALVCVIKGIDNANSYAQNENLNKFISSSGKMRAICVLPADFQADLGALATALGGKKASLASPSEVTELTDCVFGSIPPFSFHQDLALIADPSLFTRFDEIAFNAGLLDKSIILNTQDYVKIANPTLINFAIKH